jgi:multiple sugar transport system substrate-binding protein
MKGKSGVSRRSFMVGMSGLGAAGLLAAWGGGPKALSAASGKKVTISFWNGSRGIDLQDFCSAGTAFSRAVPNVAVHCAGYSDLSQVETATAAGNPPDLVQTYAWSQLPTLFQQGAVIPLNSYMKRDHFDTSIILPGILPATHTIKGEYFGLPFMAYSTTDFFWNKKIFEQKGLDPTKPPQTLEELKTIGAKFDQYRNGKLVKVGSIPSITSALMPGALHSGRNSMTRRRRRSRPWIPE